MLFVARSVTTRKRPSGLNATDAELTKLALKKRCESRNLHQSPSRS